MPEWREWATASDGDWIVANQREAVIRPLADQVRLTAQDVAAATFQLNLSRAMLYRLIQRYKQRPQTSSLLPWKRGRDRFTQVIDQDREDLINICIQEFYLTPQRPSIAAFMRELRRRFVERCLSPPHYRTVRRRLEAVNAREVVRQREGAKAARAKFGLVKHSPLHNLLPLDLIQIDHTLVDVILVDQRGRLPIGRPWLTLAVDVASRMVAGFHVSLDPPSALAVSLVMTHAVLSKEQWLADRELPAIGWPVAGIPRVIHLDNAKEFHSEALLRGCQEYGIQIEHRPPATPHFGGHIERLIGTMMGAVHLLPGTTFSNVQQKGHYDSEAHAALTLPELERWLALQISGVYHLTVHSQLEKTPQESWREGLAKKKHPARHPADTDEFFLDFLPAVSRLVQKDGIRFHKVRYWASVLSPWAGRLRQPLLVKYDPRNISRLYIRDPNGRHWPIPYADLGQPPVALWELMEARSRLRREGARSESEAAIFNSILEQRRIVDSAVRTSRQRRRQERTAPAATTTPAPAPPPQSPPQNVEPYPVEDWKE
jgi:putative transposase